MEAYKMKKLILIALISSLSYAEDIPSNCIEPVVPLKFKNHNEYNSFNSAAQMYLSCLKEFGNQQKDIAKIHIDSARRAYDKLNAFVDKTNSSSAFANSTPAKASNVQGSTGVPVGGSHNVGHSDPTKVLMNFSF